MARSVGQATALIARFLVVFALGLALPMAWTAGRAEAETLVPTVEVQAYQDGVGWRAPDASGSTSGGDGLGLPLQRLRLTLDDPDLSEGLSLSVYQGGAWSAPVGSGQTAGRAGQSIEAVRMRLTGRAADLYDLAYRTSCVDVGWLGWTSADAVAGAPDFLAVEAVQVELVPKGAALPTGGGSPTTSAPGIEFSGYVSGKGWTAPVTSGNGVGQGGLPLHGFRLSVTGDGRLQGSVRYRVSTLAGWQGWVADGQDACAIVPEAPIQAVQIQLTGKLAERYDLWYHVFAPGFGWMGYTKDGATAGTTGIRVAANAIQVHLLPKGSAAPGSTTRPSADVSEFSKLGWQNPPGRPQVSSRSVVLPSYCTGYFTYVTPSRISVFATRQECIEAFIGRAFDYLGTPFIEPYSCAPGQGVDCSGLVLQCLYACGVDMGIYNPYNHRWLPWQCYNSMNWYREGTFQPVAVSARQRGDLLYYNGHVAIYLGNDQIIDAYPPCVSVRSMWYSTPIGAARPFV